MLRLLYISAPSVLGFYAPLPPPLRLFLYHYLFRSLYLSAPSLAVILRTPLRLFLLSSVAFFLFLYLRLPSLLYLLWALIYYRYGGAYLCVCAHRGGMYHLENRECLCIDLMGRHDQNS